MRYFLFLLSLILLTFACGQEGANTEVDPETGELISRPKEKPAQEMAQPTGVVSEIDSRYRLVELAMDNGTLPLDSIEITALFKEGVLTGNGGCNFYDTSFSVAEDKSIEVGKIATTKKMCKGIMGIENKYLELLGKAESYEKPDANQLRIYSEGGALTFALQDK